MPATAAPTLKPPTMSWDDFEKSPYWNALSPARQTWLAAYLTNGGNSLAACRVAYPDAKEKSLRCMSYELPKIPEIVDAVSFYRGGPSLEEQIAGLQRTLRTAPPYAQGDLRRLLAELTGLVTPGKSAVTPASNPTELKPTAEPVEPVAPIADSRVPADHLEVWSDPKTGVVIGYRAADGTPVKLS